jgi:surface carbohydrate biosynthesis protein
LGYELLARGFKCVILKARCDYLKKRFNINFSESFNHGWPLKFKKNYGDFWSNKFDQKIFKKILVHISNLNYREWNKILFNNRNKLYNHNYKNKKFYKILNQILNEKK